MQQPWHSNPFVWIALFLCATYIIAKITRTARRRMAEREWHYEELAR